MLVLAYKDITAEIDFDWVNLHWVGRAVNTDDAVGFQGATVDEAEKNFRAAIDAYLAGFEVPERELDEAV